MSALAFSRAEARGSAWPEERGDFAGSAVARPVVLMHGSVRRPVPADWPCAFSFDAEQPFDALIVTAGGAGDAEALLRRRGAWLAPVANLSGEPLPFADLRLDDTSAAALHDALHRLLGIAHRLRELPPGTAASLDPETLLLARVYSRGGELQPEYDPSSRGLLRYPAAGLLQAPWRAAERLVEAGCLSRRFFDRMHVCPQCRSSRLHVREECAGCRSADLIETSIIHHFRCAHQAVERSFAQGDVLVCPKCARRLRHFGIDYDRPGSALLCRACGHAEADPAIGFVCLDCGARADAAAVGRRDRHAYALTDLGRQRLLAGETPPVAFASAALDGFRALARQWLRIRARYGRPATVLRIGFARAGDAEAAAGARAVALARRQALEIVRNELRETDCLAEVPEGILVLLPETDEAAAREPARRMLERIRASLAIDLGPAVAPVDPDGLLRGE